MKAYVARVELACPLVRKFKATLFLWALQKVRTFQSNSVVFDLCEFVPDCARLNWVPQNDSKIATMRIILCLGDHTCKPTKIDLHRKHL